MSVGTRAADLHRALRARRATVASAESLTGGAVADLLSSTPGASETFVGGVVAYATRVKVEVLGVSEETLAESGAVSRACALEMASGVRTLLGADFAVSTTGVAGPDEQDGQPVGRVLVAVAGAAGTEVVELQLDGDRAAIRRQVVDAALAALLAAVSRDPEPATAEPPTP